MSLPVRSWENSPRAALERKEKKKVLVRARSCTSNWSLSGREHVRELVTRAAKLPVSSQGCVQWCIHCFHRRYDRSSTDNLRFEVSTRLLYSYGNFQTFKYSYNQICKFPNVRPSKSLNFAIFDIMFSKFFKYSIIQSSKFPNIRPSKSVSFQIFDHPNF